MTKPITLREHLSRIAKIKTPATTAARKANGAFMYRCRQLQQEGLDKEAAKIQARLERDAVKTITADTGLTGTAQPKESNEKGR